MTAGKGAQHRTLDAEKDVSAEMATCDIHQGDVSPSLRVLKELIVLGMKSGKSAALRRYLRNPLTDLCVRSHQCPIGVPQCSYGEEYLSCGYASNEQCHVNAGALQKEKCTPGCYCVSGKARINGHCVPNHQCPRVCPANEEYSVCGNSCRESCGTSKDDCGKTCETGCFCIAGYNRVGGVCVPKSNCPPPKCPGPHEVFTICGTHCLEDCSKSEKDCSHTSCKSGCFCEKNYKRIDGICVSKDKCEPEEQECEGKNQAYNSCGKSCLDECGKTRKDCLYEKCYSGCFCLTGYKRINGVCVPEEKCEPEEQECEGKNQVYNSCGKSCLDECGKTRKDCLYEKCYSGCFCLTGYKRINGVCVPEEKCEPEEQECEGKNQVYNSCGKSCLDECGKTRKDCLYEKCYSGCFCLTGHKRINGVCVPEEKCEPEEQECQGKNQFYSSCGKSCLDECESKCNQPECSGPNEAYLKCGNHCEEECKTIKGFCKLETCSPGCYCKPGYKRVNGICVLESLCNCPPNEIFELSSECSEKCFHTDHKCLGAQKYHRCTCKDGFRRINGVCLPDDKCQCPTNEEYVFGNHCQENCESGPQDCKNEKYLKACFCKYGYRRINGICVEDTQCPCGKNEEYMFGNDCYDTCLTDPETCRLDDTYKRCSCLDGFKRIHGICLPDTKCKCPVNEEVAYTNDCYEQCEHDPEVCAELETIRRCACIEGYVRISGVCVPESNCPCAENEEYAVGSLCEEDCSSTPDSFNAVVNPDLYEFLEFVSLIKCVHVGKMKNICFPVSVSKIVVKIGTPAVISLNGSDVHVRSSLRELMEIV
ncbi:zonadhesin-like [Phlebotomus argentipes]|uniref:zonadhesin-like n=1 Tax=Phlebotomus argentipes TaxID=94469 RepID=UPI0028936439|nr:zonadhesin-like [Phlebotomus argentipes]